MKITMSFLFLFILVINSKTNGTENTTDNKIFIVNASSLILRERPSINSKKIMKLYSGRAVNLIEITDIADTIEGINAKWFKIATKDNKIGYVFSGFLVEPESCNNAKKYELNDDLLQPFKKNTGNHWDGYDELEKHNLQKYKFISRANDTLTIKLSNSEVITYKDIIPGDGIDEIKIKKYYFRESFEKIKYCIVSAAFYESGGEYLINLKNGKKVNIWSVPILISPDNKYVLIISSSAISQNGIQIVGIGKNGPIIIFEKEYNWNPITAKWINSYEAEITVQRYKQQTNKPIFLGGEGCYISKIHVINNNGSWAIDE